MNQKSILSLVAFIVLALSGNAQIDMGLRFQTGIQTQNSESIYLIGPNRSVDYKLQLNQITNSQSVGIYSQFNFGWLYVQPEVLYTKYDVNYDVLSFNSDSDEMKLYSETVQRIDFPVNAGLRWKNFRIGGGPVFQMFKNLNSELVELNNLEIKEKAITAGFQGGIGIDFGILHFDLKYQRDFNSVSDHISFGKVPTKLKTTPSSFQIGMAIALGKE